MSKPVVIWTAKDEIAKTTTLRVNIDYLQSLENHLKMICAQFTVYEVRHKDIGQNNDGTKWDIFTQEIVIHELVNLDSFLEGWVIPQV